MTQIKRTDDLQIYAGLAARIGLIAKQYDEFTKSKPENEIYDATLTICLLQSLLTNSLEEAIRCGLKDWNKGFLNTDFSEKNSSFWSINFTDVKRNDFGPLKRSTVLKNMRHALSHPCITKPVDAIYPSTGYWIPNNRSELVKDVIFVRAPYSENNAPRPFKSSASVDNFVKKTDSLKNMPIVPRQLQDSGKYHMMMEGKIFCPTFMISISLEALKLFVIELSNALAQPLRKDWLKANSDIRIVDSDDGLPTASGIS